jgi:AraC-like DNA-binding protein
LHGSFETDGISVEWHEFSLDRDMDWGRSFHPGSLEICLNFSGTGTLHDGDARRDLGPNEIAVYTVRERPVNAVRRSDTLHRFLTLELSPDFLQTHLSGQMDSLKPPVQRFIERAGDGPPFLEIQRLPASFLAARLQFLNPPVPDFAHRTWYLGRVLEILACTLFPPQDPDELFCKRHQRTNSSRIERVRFLIERDIENPPTLEMLADEVGCSTFYLSRMFAQEAGTSIPKFLRMKRIEKAAELLRGGRMNVTEVAMTVGYSSLSAFSKAFVDVMGCCPGLYPHGKIAGR